MNGSTVLEKSEHSWSAASFGRAIGGMVFDVKRKMPSIFPQLQPSGPFRRCVLTELCVGWRITEGLGVTGERRFEAEWPAEAKVDPWRSCKSVKI